MSHITQRCCSPQDLPGSIFKLQTERGSPNNEDDFSGYLRCTALRDQQRHFSARLGVRAQCSHLLHGARRHVYHHWAGADLLSEHTLPQKFADFVHERADAEYKAFAEHLPGRAGSNVGQAEHGRGFGYAMNLAKDEGKDAKIPQDLKAENRDKQDSEDIEPGPHQQELDIAMKFGDDVGHGAKTLQFSNRDKQDSEDIEPSPHQEAMEIAMKFGDDAGHGAKTLQCKQRQTG